MSEEKKLCYDCQLRLNNNVLRVLDCKVDSCKKIIKEAPVIQQLLCNDCKAHQDILYRVLEGSQIPYAENTHLVRGLDYYTMTVFELKINKEENAVAGGGRYNNLVRELGGPQTPACGFAIGMDRLCASVSFKAENEIKVAVFFLGEKALKQGFNILNKTRIKGIKLIADYSERSLKNHLKIANKEGYEHVLILGEDEISKNSFLYKNMKDGKQKNVGFEQISTFLKELKDAQESYLRTA